MDFVAYSLPIIVGLLIYFRNSQPTFLLILQDENVKVKKWSLLKDKKGRIENEKSNIAAYFSEIIVGIKLPGTVRHRIVAV